ncbi:MAG: glutamate--tRNA ligase [Alphaproteobacteria bacterium]|nr:glutamate--tRNA ligase [Alphaproteobacteria bacterium]MCB9984954.1 glutamate--tRNA ligase [Micavibrio sp.]HRK97345.1 glutamate--tRNA ligase [Alphaproteobacteria bacterium]
MTQKVRVRFAPSPTGMLHIGNVRTALITWLFAQANNGYLLLRIDDTDTERSKPEFEAAIYESLTWLGITWDELAHQSKRLDRYNEVIEQLKADGRLYACYETPEELSLKRKSQLSQGLPPIYDRGSLNLSADQKAKYQEQGRKPHWRFLMKDQPIIWQDLIRGEVRFEGRDISDPVLIREDGTPLYHLCSVIDDGDFGMTHIVRGEDHVSNTASHIQMFEAIGTTPPQFAHLPLISDAEGGKLSKRLGSLSIIQLRDEIGLEPLSISSLLSRLGTSDPIEAYSTYTPLIENFEFSKFGRGTPKFDQDELLRLNSKILHGLDFDHAKIRLAQIGLEDITEDFWNVVRPNLEKITDIREWWTVANGPVLPIVNDNDFAIKAIELMPPAPWTSETWKEWTSAIKTETGRKGKDLFMPLRQALTGMDHGPELGDLLPLIGPEKAKARLSKQAA